MSATIALIGSLITIIGSAVATWATILKTRSDRQAGVESADLERSRFGLEALRTTLEAKDALLDDYRQQITELKARIEELESRS